MAAVAILLLLCSCGRDAGGRGRAETEASSADDAQNDALANEMAWEARTEQAIRANVTSAAEVKEATSQNQAAVIEQELADQRNFIIAHDLAPDKTGSASTNPESSGPGGANSPTAAQQQAARAILNGASPYDIATGQPFR